MEDGRMQRQWVVTFRNGTEHSYEYFDDEMVQNVPGTQTSLMRSNAGNGGTVRMLPCSPGGSLVSPASLIFFIFCSPLLGHSVRCRRT